MRPSLTHVQTNKREERGIPPGLCPSRKGGFILCDSASRSHGQPTWALVVPQRACWRP